MRFVAVALAVAACAAEAPPRPTPGVTYLTPTEHLERVSMALRGIRPSLEDLYAVYADPSVLPELVDHYLSSPEFGATIRELHNDALLLRAEVPYATPPPLEVLADRSFTEMSRSIFDEPLRLIEDVIMTDQPYTHIMTASYTMADPIVAAVWSMPHGDNDAWERTVHDEHAPIGILASSAIFLRYRSTAHNYNRGRANALSRGLLCHDFLDGDVHLDTSIDLSDPAIVANAVVQNPACAACHNTLDPLASYFFSYRQGTFAPTAYGAYPIGIYDPKNAGGWFLTTNRPPSYFGRDADGLPGLAAAIADDPRFARCAAIHFASYLTERPNKELSPVWIANLQSDFVASGYNAKQLARKVVLSDEFREASADDLVDAAAVIGYQKVRPQQLSRMLYDLTGYEWTGYSGDTISVWKVGQIDYLDDDYSGFRVLAGGIDSTSVMTPVHTMNPTSSLVARLAARKSAEFVVASDAAAAARDRKLLLDGLVTERDAVRRQLARLHARIYGEIVGPEAAELDDTFALFAGAYAASGDPQRAWTVTLTGMLSDLRALYY